MSELHRRRYAMQQRSGMMGDFLLISGFGDGDLSTALVADTQNWVEHGMVENSIAVFDESLAYMEGQINVFLSEKPSGEVSLCFSKTRITELTFIGRVVASVNLYSEGDESRMENGRRKVYVAVKLDVDAEGNVLPRAIVWEDGHTYLIDRVVDRRRAASTKVGGCGIRYTVRIEGKERFLFNEDSRWFVEAKDYGHDTVAATA